MYLRPKPRTSAPPDPQVGYLAQQLLLQHAPGEKIGVGQPNWAQPITINLPNQHEPKSAQMFISCHIFASRMIQSYPSIPPGAYGSGASENGFGYEDTQVDMFLDTKNYPKTWVLLHLDTLAYLKIWGDIFGYESRFRIPLSIPFQELCLDTTISDHIIRYDSTKSSRRLVCPGVVAS